MSKALIISVGGSPEPIVKSIEHHRPGFVCFLVSQESIDRLGRIKDELSQSKITFDDWKIIVENAEDIEHCYEKAIDCSKIIEEKATDASEIIVDFTPGTKAMTAALTMMAIAKGYHRLSYVGGSQRNREGLGVVVTGTEKIVEKRSPWLLFAMDDKRKLCQYFNSYNFEAAFETAQKIRQYISFPSQKALMDSISLICEGYMCWDRFDHREAVKKLQEGKKRLQEFLDLMQDKRLLPFLEKVDTNYQFLCKLQGEETRDEGGEYHLKDLLSNAARRSAQNRYDDAGARLYRALEMLGQIEFRKRFQCLTGDVKIENLPKHLQSEYCQRYMAADGKVKLALFATFEALKEAGCKIGQVFAGHLEEFKKRLNARNSSILAHGINPTTKEAYDSFTQTLKDVFNLEGELIFPQLNL